MIVVGALVAAMLSMPSSVSAAHYRGYHVRGIAGAARSRRAVAWTSFRRVRPASGHTSVSRGHGFARAATYGRHYAYAGRGHAWRRTASRGRVATVVQAAPTPFAGLLPFATRAASVVAAPVASVVAPVVSGGQTGRASFYGGGGRTAAGGHVGAATCAHRSLPFGTRVLVTNLANARSTVLTVNDRGPFVRGRIVDVSVGAAGTLGMLHSGTAPVRVQVVGGRG